MNGTLEKYVRNAPSGALYTTFERNAEAEAARTERRKDILHTVTEQVRPLLLFIAGMMRVLYQSFLSITLGETILPQIKESFAAKTPELWMS